MNDKKITFKSMVLNNFPFLIGVPALVWQVLFFYVPLGLVLFLSIRTGSFEYFVPFFSWVYGSVLVRTVLLALSTALICLCLAYPVAYWIAFYGRRCKTFFIFLLFVPFWTNFLLHVYAWMFILEREGVVNTLLLKIGLISEPLHLLNSVWAVALLMVYCYLPFALLPIYSSLEQFNLQLCEASLDLGGTWWQTFRRIILPLSWPGIRSAFFLVFVPAFGEFAIPELVGGDRVMFVGNVVSQLILGSQTTSLGAAFTVLASIVLVVIVLLIYVLMRRLVKIMQ